MMSGLQALLDHGHPLVSHGPVAVSAPAAICRTLAEGGLEVTELGDPQATAWVLDHPASGCRLTGEHRHLLDLLIRAESAQRPVLVLDRPLPLGGSQMEGPTADLRAHPLAPAVPLPFRHGLTLGELARWMVRRSGLRVQVEVVECTGWDRRMGPHPRPSFSQTVWHLPELFCGLGVVAAAADWEWTAGPGAQLTLAGRSIDGDRLGELLELGALDADLHGVSFLPHSCGLTLRLDEPHSVDALAVGLVVLEALTREHEARASAPFWATEGTQVRIDALTDSPELRAALTARIRPSELAEAWAPALEQFADDRERVLLY